jgi:tetratricopeptide (TPR) repeat protein
MVVLLEELPEGGANSSAEPSAAPEAERADGGGEAAVDASEEFEDAQTPAGAVRGACAFSAFLTASPALAEEYKAQGNAAFGRGEYVTAEEMYSRAIEAMDAEEPGGGVAATDSETRDEPSLLPQRPPPPRCVAVYFANRAACRLSLGQLEQAAADCSNALCIDAVYVKALLRRATAYERQGDLELLEKATAGARGRAGARRAGR